VEALYRENLLAKGQFTLSGRPARLESLRCPLLAVTFEHDGIVPFASAAPLVERAGSADKRRLHLSGGHVGAVVSRAAARGLWPELSRWWAERQEISPPRRRRA
jgi:polyhydroxyalkanoate synthase